MERLIKMESIGVAINSSDPETVLAAWFLSAGCFSRPATTVAELHGWARHQHPAGCVGLRGFSSCLHQPEGVHLTLAPEKLLGDQSV